MQPGEFAQEDLIYQLGMPPSRIDVVTSVTGVTFDHAWHRRKEADFDNTPVHFIGLDDLLINKRALGGTTDLADCERLEEAKGSG